MIKMAVELLPNGMGKTNFGTGGDLDAEQFIMECTMAVCLMADVIEERGGKALRLLFESTLSAMIDDGHLTLRNKVDAESDGDEEDT